jgi:hypothetical protein
MTRIQNAARNASGGRPSFLENIKKGMQLRPVQPQGVVKTVGQPTVANLMKKRREAMGLK